MTLNYMEIESFHLPCFCYYVMKGEFTPLMNQIQNWYHRWWRIVHQYSVMQWFWWCGSIMVLTAVQQCSFCQTDWWNQPPHRTERWFDLNRLMNRTKRLCEQMPTHRGPNRRKLGIQLWRRWPKSILTIGRSVMAAWHLGNTYNIFTRGGQVPNPGE